MASPRRLRAISSRGTQLYLLEIKQKPTGRIHSACEAWDWRQLRTGAASSSKSEIEPAVIRGFGTLRLPQADPTGRRFPVAQNPDFTAFSATGRSQRIICFEIALASAMCSLFPVYWNEYRKSEEKHRINNMSEGLTLAPTREQIRPVDVNG